MRRQQRPDIPQEGGAERRRTIRPEGARQPDQSADQRDHGKARQPREGPSKDEGEAQHVGFPGTKRADPAIRVKGEA
jgi:hypothetical protein